MGFDPLDLLISIIIFLIYGSTCIISLIFTFSLETYLKIDEILNFYILLTPEVAILDTEIDSLDTWLMDYHKIVGLLLALLSLVTLKTWFDILYIV